MDGPPITRAMVALARSIDDAGLTRREAGKLVAWDPGHLGKVLLGRPPGRRAMQKAAPFVQDMNLWGVMADNEGREEYVRRMASIDARARRKAAS